MIKKTKIDAYTKSILTVIAICLVWICLRDINLFPKAYAADNIDIVDVRIRAVEKTQGQRWDSLVLEVSDNVPVEVKNDAAIPVDIKNDLLPVDVKNVEVKKVLTIKELKRDGFIDDFRIFENRIYDFPLLIKNICGSESKSIKLSASSTSFWELDFPKAMTST